MNKKNNGALPVLALVFAFVFPAAGIILAIVSLAKKNEKKGLSIAALIISIIWQGILFIIIVVIGSGTLLVRSLASHERDEINNVDGKKLTNYYYDSPIVSARFFHREETGLVYQDIPEDRIEDLIKTLDSLTIEHTSGIHNDYFYGMQKGIECTLEDGTFFTFDGEKLEYHEKDGDIKSRFLHLDKSFEEVMKDFLFHCL
ncbi:MAG: hypothetical protein J5518_01895 [Lachnospiraceae bacterium]|nr:hypothetical protein [Lachnospiraceae bacterium]